MMPDGSPAMVTAALLLALILALKFALELLGAFHGAFLQGHVAALNKEGRIRVTIVSLPIQVTRFAVVWLMAQSGRISLWFHELAHAIVQALTLARPRIVMCNGGGYAEARPWGLPGGRFAYVLGATARNYLCPMAPLLLGAGALLAAMYWLTPLRGSGELTAWAVRLTEVASLEAVRSVPRTMLEVALDMLRVVASAGALKAGLILLLGIMLASGLTPSSVDYIYARWSIVGFVAAVLAAAAVYEHVARDRAMLVLLAAAGASLLLYLRTLRHDVCNVFGTASVIFLAAALVARTATPMAHLHHALGLYVVLLVVGAVLTIFLLALMVVLSVVALRVRPLWEALKALPSSLRSVFTFIAICEEKKMMFQDRCDYCQCTLAQFKERGCGGKDLKRAKKSSWRDLYDRIGGQERSRG